MSYGKAMRHARNVRKTRKQGKMHFGFDTGSAWPNPRNNPATAAWINIRDWFACRHRGTAEDRANRRAAIREQISDFRSLTNGSP